METLLDSAQIDSPHDAARQLLGGAALADSSLSLIIKDADAHARAA
jgi:hypothetical protein